METVARTVVDPLVNTADAGKILGGVKPDTLRLWVREGKLPPPVKLSHKVSGWRASVLEAVIARAEAAGQ